MNSATAITAPKIPSDSWVARSVHNLALTVAATLRLSLKLGLFSVLLVSTAGQAQTLRVLHSFTGGAEGVQQIASLIQDAQGNLYSTTVSGGAYGHGSVFILSPSGGLGLMNYTEKVLYSFTGGADGDQPIASLIQDAQGNLYGTTDLGGDHGNGTVFVVSPSGTKGQMNYTEKVLYSFTGGADGGGPTASLIQDAKGNLYGTTYSGGAYGNGTVLVVSRSGAETVLYSFTGGVDGGPPNGSLIRDAQGNLYGTTVTGGAYGGGTVFKTSPISGAEKILYSFTGSGNTGEDAAFPGAGLVLDTQGNLYGTTQMGGMYGWGTVYKVSPSGAEKILYSFTGGADGGVPFSSLIRDTQGNLYGTTSLKGAYGFGTVFMLAP
jgi:uncharacterized repeat protein (TIGR03803 family)